MPNNAVTQLLGARSRADGVMLADGWKLLAGSVVVTAGAWTAPLLEKWSESLPIFPVQGQMIALQVEPGTIRGIVQVGRRYVVPRNDGVVLVGSTEEQVGWEPRPTNVGAMTLHHFAGELFPELLDAPMIAHWAGLRPGCRLRSPIIGRLGDWENVWVAAGHFRKGLQLAPGTARLIADWLAERPTFANPGDFDCDADRSTHQSLFVS